MRRIILGKTVTKSMFKNGGKDYDKDGLNNNKELVIERSREKYVWILKSNPVKRDTDGDGINDFYDDKPFDPQEYPYKNSPAMSEEDFNKFIIDNGLSASKDILAQMFNYYLSTSAVGNINSIVNTATFSFQLNSFAKHGMAHLESSAAAIADMAYARKNNINFCLVDLSDDIYGINEENEIYFKVMFYDMSEKLLAYKEGLPNSESIGKIKYSAMSKADKNVVKDYLRVFEKDFLTDSVLPEATKITSSFIMFYLGTMA